MGKTSKNLRIVRPGLGLLPKYYDIIIGKKVKFPYKTKFTSKKIRLIHKNIFNSRLMNNHDLNNSTVVLTTLNSKKKNFFGKAQNPIMHL